MKTVPESRITPGNDRSPNPEGDFVLYWMTANRRTTWNYAFQRAVEWSLETGKPLLILEALRCGYRWASDRHHRFVLDGMAANTRALANAPVRYFAYVEPEAGAGKGLLRQLGKRAAVIVTDEFPAFMLPRMTAAAANQVPVLLETVDANGILPLRATGGRVFPTAYAFRRFLHQTLPDVLEETPKQNPLRGVDLPPAPALPREITRRWPEAPVDLLEGRPGSLEALPIDHDVPPVDLEGGEEAARNRLRRFLKRGLPEYAERNHPDRERTSGLSPYLHFGHVSSHEIFHEIARAEAWTPDRLPEKGDGRRSGWWKMSEGAEGFLDQLVTWRELGFNMSFHRDDYDRYESLPPWALETLADHEKDPRKHRYSLGEFEAARTHDPLWNAAQRQLARDGVIHNYMRMLWGKKILEWTASPREALEIMIELNNKYGVDGRDPNSTSGIFWILGRYDRPWGPERKIYGKVRYMASENTAKKLRVKEYLARYGEGEPDLFRA